jgi:hypothetical protein
MSVQGYSRHFDNGPATSGLPPINGHQQSGTMGPVRSHAVQHNWRDEQLDLTPAATLRSGYKSSTEKDVTEVFEL